MARKNGLALTIRKYRPEDREQCRALWRELTDWHRQIYEDPSIGGDRPEDHFDKHSAEVGRERLWVAVYGTRAVGLAGLIVRGPEAEIEPLVVSAACRRKGIGQRLVRAVISEARKLNVRFLMVRPVARNVHAIEFLYHQGFKSLGQIELCMDFCNYAWKRGPVLFDLQYSF